MNPCAIYVEHWTFPPTERIVAGLRNVIGTSYGIPPCIETGRLSSIADINDCVRYTFSRADEIAKIHPDALIAASVVPMQLSLLDGETVKGTQNMFFVSARNQRGYTWMYRKFVGDVIVPENVDDYISVCINQALEERRIDPDPGQRDCFLAMVFMEIVAETIMRVLVASSTAHRTERLN